MAARRHARRSAAAGAAEPTAQGDHPFAELDRLADGRSARAGPAGAVRHCRRQLPHSATSRSAGPDLLLADKGYAHDSPRAALRRRRIRHVIPERSDQQARRAAKGARGGRPPDFDKEAYRQRNVVERCFNRLKQWRDLATRYAKRAAIYRASLVLISALIWLT
jgi:transposase